MNRNGRLTWNDRDMVKRAEKAEKERDEWRQAALEERAGLLDALEQIKVRDARIKAVETVIDRADWREAELPDYPVPHGNGRGPALIDTDTIRRALDGDT